MSRLPRPSPSRVVLFLGTILACAPAGALPAAAAGFRLDPGSVFGSVPPTEPGFHLSDASVFSMEGAGTGSRLFGRDATLGFGLASATGNPGRWSAELAPVAAAPHRHDRSNLVATGFTGVFLGLEYLAFWGSSEVRDEFQWANEGWFDPDTYTGGADKGSHLVGGYIAGRFLESALSWGGSPPGKSQFVSAAMIAITGTLIEVGDAYHGFGFSWQDAAITAAGGIAGSLIAAYHLDDTITMRFGMVGIDYPDDPSVVIADPNHYSGEVYTVDVRMSGLLPRLGRAPGMARFLLASLTYGTKGYPWVEGPYRQRRIGLEIAIDAYEVGLALGLRPGSWWGGPLLGVLRYFRIPFTGIGFQYELNSRRFMGPNSFHDFDR